MRYLIIIGIVCQLAVIVESFLLTSSNGVGAAQCIDLSEGCTEITANAASFCQSSIIKSSCPKTCGSCAHWTEWTSWQCNMTRIGCFQHRFRNCSTVNVSECGAKKEKWDIKACTSCSDELTTVPTPTGTDTTVSSTFAWWSDWGHWNCTEQTLDKTCEMYRERQCKTNNTDDCLRGSATEKRPCDGVICPAQWGAWGRWQCKETSKVCWMLRSRECSTGNKFICGNSTNNTDATNCNNTICPAHWTAWAEWQCAQLGTICLMARFRNCSTGDVSNCGQESERREQTHFDCDICPDNGFTGFAHWENWSTWKCKLGLHGTCSMSRYRNCFTAADGDCKGDHLETLNCTQQECPDHYGVVADCSLFESAKSPCTDMQTCDTFTNAPNLKHFCPWSDQAKHCPVACGCCETGLAGTQWENWSTWECKLGLHGTCTMSRYRNCSTTAEGDCKGDPFETLNCTEQICPHHFGVLVDCTVFESAKSLCRDVNATCDSFSASPMLLCNTPYQASHCPVTCGCCAPNLTESSLSTMPYTTTHSNSPEPTPPTISSHWEEWGNWRCKTVDKGECVMFRDRNCSTGVIEQCGAKDERIFSTKCNEHICKDRINMTQCSNYFSDINPCKDATDTCKNLTSTRQACNNGYDIASTLCPKSCGCCENEIEVYIAWESWSSWMCNKLNSGLYTTCHMSRHRLCSSGNLTDCVGIHSEIKACQGLDCSDTAPTNVNCSLYNRTSACEDQTECTLFYDKPEFICSNPALVAKCPLYCGCCHETSLTAATLKSTLQLSTTSSTLNSLLSTSDMYSTSNTSYSAFDTTTVPVINRTETTTISTCTEWGYWHCHEGTLNGSCVMTRIKELSDNNVKNCEPVPENVANDTRLCESDICPAHWTAWSEWKCTQMKTLCFMARFRGCSTGNISNCGESSGRLEDKHFNCDICPGQPSTEIAPVTTASPIEQGTSSNTSTGNGAISNQSSTEMPPVTTASPIEQGTSSNTSTGNGAFSNQSSTETPPVTTASPIEQGTSSNTSTGNGTISNQSSTEMPPVTTASPIEQGTSSNTSTGNGAISNQSSTEMPPETTASPIEQGTSLITSTGNGAISNQSSTETPPVTTSSPIEQGTSSNTSTGNGATSNQSSTETPPETTASPTGQGTSSNTSTGNGATSNQSSTEMPPVTTASPIEQGTSSNTSTGNGTISNQSSTETPPVTTVTSVSQSIVLTSTSKLPYTIDPQKCDHTGHCNDTSAECEFYANDTVHFCLDPNITNLCPKTCGCCENETTSIKPSITTETPSIVLTSTSKQPYTLDPTKPLTCVQCAGPDFLCEKLYEEVDCESGENYCINKIVNKKDGSRSVWRGCGDFNTCYKDWFLGSSDIDKCRQFDENNFLTLDFDCTFCCIEDRCNEPLRPDSKSLYKDL